MASLSETLRTANNAIEKALTNVSTPERKVHSKPVTSNRKNDPPKKMNTP